MKNSMPKPGRRSNPRIKEIIELKICLGECYNAEGEQQISEYLDFFGLTTGYMLSFNFNKKRSTASNVNKSTAKSFSKECCSSYRII